MTTTRRLFNRFAWLMLAGGLLLAVSQAVLLVYLLAPVPAADAMGSGSVWAIAVSGGLAVLVVCLLAYGALRRYVLRPLARSREIQAREVGRSEQRLQLAVAGSNDGLFDYDPVGRRLYLSDVLRGWLRGAFPGDQPGELEVDDVVARIHPAHLQRVSAAFKACGESGHSFDVEFPLLRADGGNLWLQVRGRGVRHEQGSYRVSGFASDISRRKVAESLLHDSVDRLSAVLDNIAEGIITLNEAGEVCAVNMAAQHMFGLDRDDFVGHALASVLELPTDVVGGWTTLADKLPREGRVLRADGNDFAAEFAVSAMHIRSDERFIVVLRDVTERKEAEDKLRGAVAETEAATRAKDEFLATMSHEIRTPMNGVLGMTQLLLDMDLGGRQRETAELIRASGESLLTIINDILDFSRAGSGRLKVDAVPFDLRQAVREVVELLGRRRHAVDLYVDYPLEVPSALVGDPGRVRQVLMNLVGNALKFTESGHVVVIVEAEAGERLAGAVEETVRLRVTVEDTGPGIAADAQSRLFQPFTQADASTTRRFGGTGLGLAISRRLVELMGGEIGVDSEPDQGSRFYFTMTLPRAAGQTSGPPRWHLLQGRRALVVDDDSRGRGILAATLRRAGMQTVALASAPAALERLEQESFDVALIDDQMPDMDGLLLCELLRIDSAWRHMSLVLMCRADSRGAQESRAVDRYLVKPVMPDYLLQEVARLLGGEQDAQQARAVPADAAALQPGPGNAPARRPQRPPADATVARVLLAEDNPVNQQVAVRMLEKLGCRIDVAENGAEALNMWRHFAYDVIFMDCQMPELDGLEAARAIRREEPRLRRARTPIVAMTANAMHQDRTDCLAAGMDDYLSKPVRQEDLQAMLASWLSQDVPRAARSGGDAG
ncbi:MAG: response regulator [Gammaproteobacteria bacterium]|nr:response regulator [Gammaproteobacteria bacterium]